MKHIYLFLFFSGTFTAALAQESFNDEFKYRATYNLTYQIDSTDASSIASEEIVLYMGDRISRFSSRERQRGDEVMQNRKNNPSAFTGKFQGAPQTKIDYYIYKGIPEGKLSYTHRIVKDNFRYIEDLNQFQWEILPETNEIKGYQVQKATTSFAGRDYVAWFTPEIPIPDGPYKFNGLPGLILEVRDTENHYSFTLASFEILQDPVSFEFDPRKYITTTGENYLKALEEYDRDPFSALGRVGVTINFRPGQKEKMERQRKEELKKKNNPIELN